MSVVNSYQYIPEWQKAQAAGTNQYAAYNQNAAAQQQMAQKNSGQINTQQAKVKTAAQKIAAVQPAQSYAYGTNPGAYTNRFGAALDDIYKQIQNRKKFKYEFNADPLFQAYKEMYLENGKQAMADAIGQASQLTGGYGNSYAEQVGQQTNQQYQRQLYDIGLDIRDRAYQVNQDELQALFDLAGLYQQQEAQDYARYMDAMSAWQAAQAAAGSGRGGSSKKTTEQKVQTHEAAHTIPGQGTTKQTQQNSVLEQLKKLYGVGGTYNPAYYYTP